MEVRVLVVDDDPDESLVTRRALAMVGVLADLTTFTDIEAASSAIASDEQVFSVVVVDAVFATSHHDVLTRLCQDGRSRRVPVVAMSSWVTPAMKTRCESAGVSEFFARPMDPRRYGQLLLTVLGRLGSASPRPASRLDAGGT